MADIMDNDMSGRESMFLTNIASSAFPSPASRVDGPPEASGFTAGAPDSRMDTAVLPANGEPSQAGPPDRDPAAAPQQGQAQHEDLPGPDDVSTRSDPGTTLELLMRASYGENWRQRRREGTLRIPGDPGYRFRTLSECSKSSASEPGSGSGDLENDNVTVASSDDEDFLYPA